MLSFRSTSFIRTSPIRTGRILSVCSALIPSRLVTILAGRAGHQLHRLGGSLWRKAGASGKGVASTSSEQINSCKLINFFGAMFLLGATIGPAVDGIHGQVHLLTYDKAPLTLGSLHTSAWVFALLGTFYATLGACFPALDSLAVRQQSAPSEDLPAGTAGSSWGPGDSRSGAAGDAAASGADAAVRPWLVSATERAVSRAGVPRAALALGVVAALHQLSSVLYSAGVPYSQISAVLLPAGGLTWLLFDGTPQGLVLACACGIGAPAIELLLMKLLGLWHYDKPDVMVMGVGLPSWVPWCYFFYTPWLACAARALWKRL